jgi:hypothetical protein
MFRVLDEAGKVILILDESVKVLLHDLSLIDVLVLHECVKL